MTIAKHARLRPPMKGFSFFVMEKGHDTFLVVYVSLLANERVLHFVNGLLEELLVLSDQEFLDVLKSAFSLRN